MTELRAMEQAGVPFYGLNLSVGLSVSITGFGADVATGLLGEELSFSGSRMLTCWRACLVRI